MKCFWSRKGLTRHDVLTRSTNGPFSVVGFCFNTYPRPLHRINAIWWPYWTLWQPSDTGKHPQITSKQIPPDRSNESWLLQTHTVPIKKRDSPSSHCPFFSFSWPPEKLNTMFMQNFGVTNKEHYGMLWYFLEWSVKLNAWGVIWPSSVMCDLLFLQRVTLEIPLKIPGWLMSFETRRRLRGIKKYIVMTPTSCTFFSFPYLWFPQITWQ